MINPARWTTSETPFGFVPMTNQERKFSSRKRYPTSILKKRRWLVQQACHPHAAALGVNPALIQLITIFCSSELSC